MFLIVPAVAVTIVTVYLMVTVENGYNDGIFAGIGGSTVHFIVLTALNVIDWKFLVALILGLICVGIVLELARYYEEA